MEAIEKILPQVTHQAIYQTKSAHTMGMLLKQLRLKEINLKEYLEACAYWGMKTLDDIYFMSLPTKPLSVVEYEQLSYYKRHRLTQEFYADNPEITKYYDQKGWIETQNKTSLINLRVFKRYLPGSEVEKHRKLDERINDFKTKMEGYER